MRVIIQQVDLDTALTGLILGVSPRDRIEIERDGASPVDLADPAVLCIEAGGSGLVQLNNFDHHAPGGPREAACLQALIASGRRDPRLTRLVEYVSAIDTGRPGRPPAPGGSGHPSLSYLISGMRLSVHSAREQFLEGMRILRTVIRDGLDPSGPFPTCSEWTGYVSARDIDRKALELDRGDVRAYRAANGSRVGVLETESVGALGLLYKLGFKVAIASSPRFRPPGGGSFMRKHTVGGHESRVDKLASHFAVFEEGWGGPAHGTIIASPRRGSALDLREIVEIVTRHV